MPGMRHCSLDDVRRQQFALLNMKFMSFLCFIYTFECKTRQNSELEYMNVTSTSINPRRAKAKSLCLIMGSRR